MGKVQYGAHETKNGQFRPFIAIETDAIRVEFNADIEVPTQEDAHDICLATYKILSGKQDNLKHVPEGEVIP